MKNKQANINLRYNFLTVIIYIIGIIILIQLFNLQIVHGEEYRLQSNTRLTRETILEAARGGIFDRSGNTIATVKTGYELELYKSKVNNQALNKTILNIVNLLEENGDTYEKNFPIIIDLETSTYKHTFSDEEKFKNWKIEYKIDENATEQQCIDSFKKKYEIENENIEEILKIINIRYEITTKGYSNTKSIQISSNLKEETLAKIIESNNDFLGTNIVQKPKRNYVRETLASHIIGYIGKITEKELETREETYNNNDYIGRTGIEYILEEYLKGTNGIKQVDMSVDGTITGEYISKEAVAGSDVILTIDANLQSVAEQALKTNIEKISSGGFSKTSDAKSGAIVIMQVKTGEVLALASYPNYNPQIIVDGMTQEQYKEIFETENGPLFNRSIQGTYAPGSIFKMVTATAALETGAIAPNTKILTKGQYQLAHKPACWLWNQSRGTHGWINVSDAIKHSCNYFFYEMGNRVGIDNIEKYAKYYGLGLKTGIELPNEAKGTVASRSIATQNGQEWQLGETLSAAIGQTSNDYSPLQIAKYISILANGGNQIRPTIIKSVVKADGTQVPKEEIQKLVDEELGYEEPEKTDIKLNPDNLQAILDGMKSVTSESGGTAYSYFRNFNIEVGGKTGSAQAGTYTNAWFAGFAPYDDPEIAVVILVENGGSGSYTAEAARDVMAQYFGMNASQITEDMTAIPYIENIR